MLMPMAWRNGFAPAATITAQLSGACRGALYLHHQQSTCREYNQLRAKHPDP